MNRSSKAGEFLQSPEWAILLEISGKLIRLNFDGASDVAAKAFLDSDARRGLKQAREFRPSRRFDPIRLLELGQLLFSHKTREKVCEPVMEELREDYLLARAKCQSSGAIRFAKLCFAWRALVAFCGCFRVSCGGALGKFIPLALKHWWSSP